MESLGENFVVDRFSSRSGLKKQDSRISSPIRNVITHASKGTRLMRQHGSHHVGLAGDIVQGIFSVLKDLQRLTHLVLLRHRFGRDTLKQFGFWWTFPLFNWLLFWGFGVREIWSAHFFWELFYCLLYTSACLYQRRVRDMTAESYHLGRSYFDNFLVVRPHRASDPLYPLTFPLGQSLIEFAIPFLFGSLTWYLHNPIAVWHICGGFVMVLENLSEYRHDKRELLKMIDAELEAGRTRDAMNVIGSGKRG